jgi:phage terminase Nu1 subunit (DNA packaging protein)
MIVSSAQYAKLRGKSRPWVTARVREGLPVVEEGKSGREYRIETGAAIDWEIQRGLGTRPDGESERDRLARVQADRVQFENEARQGEFIPIRLHGELLRKVAGEIAGQMAGFPGRVAPKVANIRDPAMVRAKLLDECNDVRNAIANLLGNLAEQCFAAGEEKSNAASNRIVTSGCTG